LNKLDIYNLLQRKGPSNNIFGNRILEPRNDDTICF